ncbi:MAG TPA: sulfite exporter TauE/SafE family protein, partial [Lachnospiraceae bacterium]|nr:sulfite exporter TauE/SafE family protein [Lachnospiraceae bacterium]
MDTILIIAVICAYVVKGLCGFANTLVFSSILSFSTSNATISPLELIVGYPSNIVIAYRERKSVIAKVWIPLAILVIAGSIPGAIFLKLGSVQGIKVLFGFAVTFIALEMLLREYRMKRRKQSRIVLMIIGILSGLLCGIFGIGALLVAYVSRTTDNSKEFR